MQVSPKPLAGGETPGVAGKWWRYTSAPFIAARGAATWAEFHTAFQRLYFPPALRQAKASELLGLRQGTINIEEYEHKFFDLLPYCPHIAESSVAKYDHFLQGLNPEIHLMVFVGSDMTYEGLVDRFHQDEDSLWRNRSMISSASRPTSSLSPRGQSFKKQGGISSSSSGSGRVQHFGSQGMSRCCQCRRKHPPGLCPRSTGVCFQCGQEGHMKETVLPLWEELLVLEVPRRQYSSRSCASSHSRRSDRLLPVVILLYGHAFKGKFLH
ncbi:uncharacterized protein [Henckelia pumila]|uniref:uncharacterized protein n=1 Tax=Henckelia pumila TaxID=405737 RepID=UPI003C6DC9B6